MAVEKENIEIVQLLISNDKIDPNIICISPKIYIKFNNKSFNSIQYQIIQLDSITNHSIQFNIKSFNWIQYQIIQWNSVSNHSMKL